MKLKKTSMTGYNKLNKGVTIIELLVTVTVFSIAITTSLSLLTSAIKEQRKALGSAYLLDTASYVTEYISRALRMAQKDLSGDCVGTAKGNFGGPDENHIKFLNYNGECQEFFLEGEAIKVRRLGVSQPLTPSNLTVANLEFAISGASQDDNLQPKVSFVLKLATKELEPKILNLQSTVSQRQLDVAY